MSGHASGAVTTSMERVLFPLKPHEDESYFGFTARLASWNGFEHRRDLLRALGLQILHTSDIYQAANDTGRLARQLGISSEELGRLTAPQLDPEYRKEFHLRRRRVSARGLNKSLHHRFSWTISRLPYCPQNWDFLAGKCPDCGHELGWSFVVDLHLCERCGYDMRRLKVVSVPTDYRRNLQFLADLVTTNATGEVSPDLKLPAVLTGEARLRVFRLTCLIGRTLALQNTKFRYSKASPLVRVKYLAKGVEVLLGYPESFDALSVGGNGPLPKQLMQLRDFTGSVPECGRLFNRLLTDWEPCRHGLKRLKRERERTDCMTVREAAKALHVENLAVRQLVDRGLIEPLDSRGSERRYDWLRREDVLRIADKLAGRLSVREFSRNHHITPCGTLQLVSSGLLALNDCPFVTELYGRPQLIRAEADAIIARLRSVVHFPAHDSETVPLEDAFHGVGDQPKPWSAMIKAALERRLELYWNGDPHETLSVKDLHISKRLAWDLAAKRRPELLEVPASYEGCLVQANLSRGEAEQYLNCFPRDVAWLLCNGRMSAEFPSHQITQLGHELISSREISWRWRVSPALRDALPTKHGIARCAGPFWPRAEIEAFFARRFPSGGPVE